MIARYRRSFNTAFSDEKYQTLLSRLASDCGTPVAFRIAETPCFLPRTLAQTLARYGREMVEQLLADTAYLNTAAATVPEGYRVANDTEAPLFVQADFGLDVNGEPKLVEIQGFPSLYAFQPALAAAYREVYGIDGALTPFLSGFDEAGYHAAVRRAIVGDHAPENVVLLEVQPYQQKTLPDFLLTERYYGVTPVCITEVRQDGNRLFYYRNGRWVPITRIYNRVIVEELMRKGITPAFDLQEELDVEWAGHPNWYFKISKFSLPYLKHDAVPETHFLTEFTALPEDLENWVLKPLFSFAGQGVIVGPTREQIRQVTDPAQYILQRRVDFVPTIDTPHGPTKVEIRVMYLNLGNLVPVSLLLRMGRGQQMGVDHNREMAWVGASAAFLADDQA